jgi:hypothetical protein
MAVTCQVDGCDRLAAASVRGDDMPGPIRLCFTHTEDFRMNASAWKVTWDPAGSGPVSVRAAPVAAVGRAAGSAAPSAGPVPGDAAWARVRSRLPKRRGRPA